MRDAVLLPDRLCVRACDHGRSSSGRSRLLFARPVAFLPTFVFFNADGSTQAEAEIKAFEDQYVRA